MLRRSFLTTTLTAFLVLGGCASGGGERLRTDANALSRDEIAQANATNLYDVVRQLRPRWLQARAARNFDLTEAPIYVFQDRVMLGDVETLRQFDRNSVYGLRYLDAAEAQATLPGLAGRQVEGAIVMIMTPPAGM